MEIKNRDVNFRVQAFYRTFRLTDEYGALAYHLTVFAYFPFWPTPRAICFAP